jgi:folate-binding protein YgfZ
MTGYEALHEGAARLDLSSRGKIRVTGEDRARLLHALLTNDVKGLAPGEGNYHFLLNAQGRIQADLNLCVLDDWILLDCASDLTSRIYETLDHYIIADDVQLEDITSRLATVAVEGPQADEVGDVAGAIRARLSATGQPGVWFFVDPERRAELFPEVPAATAEEARVVRVENGVPQYGEDFGDTTLAQETQQMRALHFTKGCYLGQEIVERIRSRGQVHRLLVRVAVEGKEPPASGTAVLAGGQEAGRLTSPVYSPRLASSLGLAIVRREFATPGTAVEVDGRPGKIL